MRPNHCQNFTSMPRGILKIANHSLGGHFPKSAVALWQVWINNCIFFPQFSMIILIKPRPSPLGIRHEVLALAHEGMWHKCYYWLRWSDSCYPQLHPEEACCHWDIGARQVHEGSSEDHTSSRLCFVQDGPTRSLHKCSGLDGMD